MSEAKCFECGTVYMNSGLLVEGYCKHCASKGIKALQTTIAKLQGENKELKEVGLKGHIPLVILDQIEALKAENADLKAQIKKLTHLQE